MKVFRFVQTTPTNTWTINHKLGCKVAFDVFLDDGAGGRNKSYPTGAIHVDDNTLQLSFSKPRSGAATIVGVVQDVSLS